MNQLPENSKSYIQSLVSPSAFEFLIAMKEMGLRRNIPNISWNTAYYILDTLRKRTIRNILEIGPANGFSTMMLSLASDTVEVTSIECSRHAFEELRHNIGVFLDLQKSSVKPPCQGGEEMRPKLGGYAFESKTPRSFILRSNSFGSLSTTENGSTTPSSSLSLSEYCSLRVDDLDRGAMGNTPAEFPPKVTSDINQVIGERFHLYYGDAREILPAFQNGADEVLCANPESWVRDIPKEQFDMIFIDGAFRMTREFFDLSRPLLAEGGIMILDDAIKYRWKMEGFHEYLETEGIHYELVQTDEDDGVMVIER